MKTAPYAKSGTTGTTSTTASNASRRGECPVVVRLLYLKRRIRIWAGMAVRTGGWGQEGEDSGRVSSLLKTANYFPNLRGRAREGAASVERKLPRGMNAGGRLEEGRNVEG